MLSFLILSNLIKAAHVLRYSISLRMDDSDFRPMCYTVQLHRVCGSRYMFEFNETRCDTHEIYFAFVILSLICQVLFYLYRESHGVMKKLPGCVLLMKPKGKVHTNIPSHGNAVKRCALSRSFIISKYFISFTSSGIIKPTGDTVLAPYLFIFLGQKP